MAWALPWTLVFREVVFATVGWINLERGSFDLPAGCTWLTFYARMATWVEGALTINLRQGMENNAEFSGGVQLLGLQGVNASLYKSLLDLGGAGGFNPRHNMLAIYNPHFTVRTSVATGPNGAPADFTYEVYAAAVVID